MGHADGGSISRIHCSWNGSISNTAIMVRIRSPAEKQSERFRTDHLRVPDNVRFEVDDVEDEEWTWPDNYFDYIHSRFMVASISSWPRLIRKAFQFV